jgi:cation:H+ antiporter
MPLTILLITGGLVALVVGAEILVRAGTGLASRLGVPPMVIGLTVISMGTSLPELAIGIDAARSGSPGLAVGNIVGTNLVNLLCILGVSALLVPIVFDRRTLRFDLPAMVVAALALYLLARDGVLTRSDGILLVMGGVIYTGGVLNAGRRDREPLTAERSQAATKPRSHPLRLVLELVGGLVAIIVGAELLVDGAVDGAHALGVTEAVIGLTVVAIGTSAPELVTTLVSTIRRPATSRSATSWGQHLQHRRRPGAHLSRRPGGHPRARGSPRLGSRAAGGRHRHRCACHADRGKDRACGRRPVRRGIRRVPRLAAGHPHVRSESPSPP